MSGSHGDPATRLHILDLLCYNKLPIVVLAFLLLGKSHSNKIICLFLVTVAHKQNTETKGLFDWSYVALLHVAEWRKFRKQHRCRSAVPLFSTFMPSSHVAH